MDLDHERLALEHLENALTWPPEEREQRLLEALGHDSELLTDVRELLRAAQSVNDALPTSLPMSTPGADVPPPARIGPYRLRDLLGQGGMGSVYRAERADGAFERTVAIKLMRKTRVPELVAAQFARERRILAGLQHRNIAQLLDGGVTAEGHSYFVMELVIGRTITQYATEENLSLHATLQLYLQVCSAVQFAHTRLVVHADIKPSNIVVTDDGVAKLLDFGVARALAEADDAAEPRAPMALTLGYASPARQRGEVSGTADDVYSLGVLLHALLSRFPAAAVPNDLRTVVERARAQNPGERYASVETLQADVQRWLGSFPVQAHRGNWKYIAGKFFVRHRLAVVASGVGVLLLASAVTALALLYTRAERARASAEERFTDLRSLSRFVLFDVYDRLESTPRALAVRRDLAEAAQRYLDRLAQDPAASEAVRLDVIEGLRRLAQVQASPGSPSVANEHVARRNLERAEALASVLPSDAVNRGARAITLGRIALARGRLEGSLEEDFPAARRALDRAAARLEEARQAEPANAEVPILQSEVVAERADILLWQGEYAQSIAVAGAALAKLDATPAEPGTRPREIERADSLNRTRLLDAFAESHYYIEDYAAADKAYRAELDLVARARAREPDDLPLTRRFMRAEWALAENLLADYLGPGKAAETAKAVEAERLLANAVSIADTLQMFEPHDRDLARTAIVMLTAHARALSALKRFGEALPLLERSVAMRRQLWAETPSDWGLARDYAMGLASLAGGRADAHQIAGACAAYAETLATLDRIRAAGHLAKLDEDHLTRLAREAQARICH